MNVAEVEAWLEKLYIGVPGTTLRKEDRKKAAELAPLLAGIERAVPLGPAVIVDAAAGKGYVGLLAAHRNPHARVVAIERDPRRLELLAAAAGDTRRLTLVAGDVADRSNWPDEPDLAVALHACGTAADGIIAAAIAARARRLLVVPCCTPSPDDAARAAEKLGLPRHPAIRRGFVETFVAGARTLRLEASGYETEVVPFVPPTVTPYNLLLRARRVGEPGRMAAAAERLARLTAV